MKPLCLRYESVEAFDADYESNLRKARAFVAGGEGLAVRERCTLEIVHPGSGATVALTAEAVWIGPAGIGLALVDLDDDVRQRLEDFANPAAPVVEGHEGQARAEPAAGEPHSRGPRNIHERMRFLSIRQREEIARHGSLTERVALERAYGGVVWEGLLQNASISTAEVARIARNGTLPKPLVGTIVNNAGWISSGEVQRALMTNPRCTGAHLERVVRAIPNNELTRLAQNCPYRSEVRNLVRQFALRRH